MTKLIRRFGPAVLAAITALALTVTALPAQASPSGQHLAPPSPSDRMAVPIKHAAPMTPPSAVDRVSVSQLLQRAEAQTRRTGVAGTHTYGPYFVCLSNSYDYCWGVRATGNPYADILLADWKDIGVGVAIAVIAYVIIKTASGGGGSAEFQAGGWYKSNPHGWSTDECMGAWGYNAHPHLAACNDPHGVYWEFHCTDSPCYKWWDWNTYSKGWLVTDAHLANGDAMWIHSIENWHTWSLYS